MSVIIKGMKLPRKSEHRECSIAVVQNRPVSIAFSRTETTPLECLECAEIPTPHGRLIDADRLMDVIEKNSYLLKGYYNSLENGMFLTGIKQAIDEAPTIIEAEGSE